MSRQNDEPAPRGKQNKLPEILEGEAPVPKAAELENPGQSIVPGPARARQTVPTYLLLGGWGDGWSELSTGAEVWLVARVGDQVRFLAGARCPVEGEIRGGGIFGYQHLDAFERLS